MCVCVCDTGSELAYCMVSEVHVVVVPGHELASLQCFVILHHAVCQGGPLPAGCSRHRYVHTSFCTIFYRFGLDAFFFALIHTLSRCYSLPVVDWGQYNAKMFPSHLMCGIFGGGVIAIEDARKLGPLVFVRNGLYNLVPMEFSHFFFCPSCDDRPRIDNPR